MEVEKSYKVSIVTAVYNVEEYLKEMVGSIIAQAIGFENVQLILVDDGSTDSSGQICDRYASQYPENVFVIHKENGGVSSARNEGLKYVKGEYVNFTDADDMLENNALELMYAYLKENEDEIDLVAIPQKLFGRVSGEQSLNYKFSKTRIVDLEKEYDCVHFAINSTLIKKQCFANRWFDNELSYAEDAQLLFDIFTDKMKYGVICETNYMYRKRNNNDSALDIGRSKPCYYIPYMEKFILYSLDKSKEKLGYVPEFIQYACMYDLSYRLKQNSLVNQGVLSEEDSKKYKTLILNALELIENKIIIEQKNLGNNYKRAILLLKKDNRNKKELVFCPNDIKICIRGCFTSVGVSAYTGEYEFVTIDKEKLIIEGYVRYFPELEDIAIILRQVRDDMLIEYNAKLWDRKEHYSFCMDEVITKAKGFQFNIFRDQMLDEMELQLCIRYKNTNIICRNIGLGKFAPLDNKIKNSYIYKGGGITCLLREQIKIIKDF